MKKKTIKILHFCAKNSRFLLADYFTGIVLHSRRRKFAFTLAEVLITLGIIGIVAAMTIPMLIANYQKNILKNQFKKAYSMLQQTWLAAENNLGTKPDCFYWQTSPYPTPICIQYNKWGTCIKYEMPDKSPMPDDYSARTHDCGIFEEQIEKELKVIKKCNNNSLANGCIPKYKGNDTFNKEQDDTLSDEDAAERNFGCSEWGQEGMDKRCSSLVLADGTIIMHYGIYNPTLFAVDLNGKKGPNKWGHDLFPFQTLTNINDSNTKVMPTGGCNYIDKGGLSAPQMLLESYK